jgi:hypothetical protein
MEVKMMKIPEVSKEKKFVYGIVSFMCLALVFSVLYSINSIKNDSQSEMNMQDNIKYSSNVCMSINGKEVQCTHNIITSNGKNYFKTSMGKGTNNTINILVLGNASVPLAASTNLAGAIIECGLANATATYIQDGVTAGVWSEYYTWTSTCNDTIVNTTALYSSPGSFGMLFGGAGFASTTLQENDKLTMNYTLSVV